MYPSLEDGNLSPLPVSGPAYHWPICVFDTVDSTEDVRLFPTLCAKCEQVGVISEWLNRTPGGRFEVIRAWNKKHRLEVRTKGMFESEIAIPKCFDHERDTESDATAAESYRAAVEDQQSSTTLIDSPPRLYGNMSGSSLQQRIEALKFRVRERLAELMKGSKVGGRWDSKG
jgi:hypothetical protein